MQACTLNLYDEIRIVLATFDPAEQITQELTERMLAFEAPMNELRSREVAGSGLSRKLMGELEALKLALTKFGMKCSRAISIVYRDRTDVDFIEGLIVQGVEDLQKLLNESPAQMLGMGIISQLIGGKYKAPESTKKDPVSTGLITKAMASLAVSGLNDAEIELALTHPAAKAFYLKHFASKPAIVTLAELVAAFERDHAEAGIPWTLEVEATIRQTASAETLDLAALNAYFLASEAMKPRQPIEECKLGPDEKSYVGGVMNGLKHGTGDLVYTDLRTYSGDFVEGRKMGKGTMTWPDGKKYVGDFLQDEETGKGTVTYSNGRKYEGSFLKGTIHGKGTYYWPDGRRYIGEFVNAMMEGYGVISSPDGKRYEGQFAANKKNGRGIHYWPDGARYEGDFKNDLKHGRGTMIEADGERTEGEWVNDQASD